MLIFFVFDGISQINITGTVTRRDGSPIEGVNVVLTNESLADVTDASGTYSLTGTTSINSNISGNNAITAPQFRGTTVSFSVIESNQLVRIDVFSVNGKHISNVVNKKLSSGSYRFPILKQSGASQVYIISLQVNGSVYKFKYLYIPGMNGPMTKNEFANGLTGNDISSIASSKNRLITDTMKLTKTDFAENIRTIYTYSGTQNFTLDTLCGTVCVYVREDSTNIPISDADVVIYNSNTNQGITRAFTGSDGRCYLYVLPNGAYYVRVAAQGYNSSPPRNGSAVPFQVGEAGSSMTRYVQMKINPIADSCGIISGIVESTASVPVPGGLVVSIRQTDSITISGFSGPDGFYIIYNVPQGNWDAQCFLSGWYQENPVTSIGVTSGVTTSDVDMQLIANAGTSLSGRITFLASQNSTVDITLAHPVSYEAIPGLDTMMDESSSTYVLNSIPPGTYIPWASYQNDGYVMDPDWIRKFGLPVQTFALGDGPKELDFSITDAVPIISPSNHPDTLVPVEIVTDTPTFVWESYPSTQEYIIAVYNSFGSLIWGGYDENDRALHAKIDAQTTSVRFNFDGSATEPIRGGSYRWKVWADKKGADSLIQFISASEDLLGLFTLPEE